MNEQTDKNDDDGYMKAIIVTVKCRAEGMNFMNLHEGLARMWKSSVTAITGLHEDNCVGCLFYLGQIETGQKCAVKNKRSESFF